MGLKRSHFEEHPSCSFLCIDSRRCDRCCCQAQKWQKRDCFERVVPAWASFELAVNSNSSRCSSRRESPTLIETEWLADALWQRFCSQRERRWAQTGLGMLYAMRNSTYCTHFPALFMGLGLCLSCVCMCVSSASRNVCAPPILRWLPKTKMAARTPEKEKERARERERWRQHAKCREKIKPSCSFSSV